MPSAVIEIKDRATHSFKDEVMKILPEEPVDQTIQLDTWHLDEKSITTPGIALDLPASTSSEPVVLNRLVVTVASPSEVYLNRERVDLSELDTRLGELAGNGSDDDPMSAVIEGDRLVPYETLVAVLDILRRNGYRGIALRTLEDQGVTDQSSP